MQVLLLIVIVASGCLPPPSDSAGNPVRDRKEIEWYISPAEGAPGLLYLVTKVPDPYHLKKEWSNNISYLNTRITAGLIENSFWRFDAEYLNASEPSSASSADTYENGVYAYGLLYYDGPQMRWTLVSETKTRAIPTRRFYLNSMIPERFGSPVFTQIGYLNEILQSFAPTADTNASGMRLGPGVPLTAGIDICVLEPSGDPCPNQVFTDWICELDPGADNTGPCYKLGDYVKSGKAQCWFLAAPDYDDVNEADCPRFHRAMWRGNIRIDTEILEPSVSAASWSRFN